MVTAYEEATMTYQGDDLVPMRQRRHVARTKVPPFPRADFIKLLRLLWAEGFSGNRSLELMMSGAFESRVPWEAMERQEFAAAWASVSGAFITYRKQHSMARGHLLCWLATEYGVVFARDGRGNMQWVWHRPDVAGAVMSVEECARHYGYTEGTVRRYADDAQKAVEDEWTDIYLIGNHG